MKNIRKKMENKGFTLVEIIVCLAIMTIVAGSVGAFIVAGNNSYLRGNKELTLQEEAQLATNQMIDLIIDVEKDIKFTNTTGTAVDLDGNPAKDDAGNEVQAQVSELLLVNNDNAYMIRWQESSNTGTEYENANQIYLYEAATEADLATAAPALMAEHVSSFQVDLSEARSKRKVMLNMLFAYQDKTYQISETIKLRNALPEDTAEHIWLEAMTVIPTNPTVEQGATKRFDYELKGEPEAVALAKKQGVSWSLSYTDGTACKSTIDSRGNVKVAIDETVGNNVLLVTCVLNRDPSFVATTTINVKKLMVESLTIDPKNAEVLRGGTQAFTYTMKGPDEAVAQGVTWSVERIDASKVAAGTVISDSGVLTVGKGETMGTSILRVTCTAKADTSKSDSAIVAVTDIPGKYTVELIRGIMKTYSFPEGAPKDQQKIGYYVDLECLTSWADYEMGYPKITWEIVGSSNGYSFAEGANKYKQILYCGDNIDTSVRIKANVQLDANSWYYPIVDVKIPNLAAAERVGAPYIASDQFVLNRNGHVHCWLENYDTAKMKDVTWRIANDVELGLAIANDDTTGMGYNEAFPIQCTRKVGFSAVDGNRANKANFPDGYDETEIPTSLTGMENSKSGSANVYPTAKGKDAYIWAKWFLDWNQEYELLLQAVDKDNNVIAETYVLIPRAEIYFPEGIRSITLNQKDFRGTGYQVDNLTKTVKVYGFEAGNKNGLADFDPRLKLIPKVTGADYPTAGHTAVSTWKGSTTEGKKGDVIYISIGSDEKNHILYVSFSDLRGQSMDRVMVIYWNTTEIVW